jgi:ABC-2 type transport system ATP-binding protein
MKGHIMTQPGYPPPPPGYPSIPPGYMSLQQGPMIPVSTNIAISIHNLTRSFGQKLAVNNLNLSVKRGEFFGFLGPNGAGKSTTIKMVTGLLRPTNGSAEIGDVDVWLDPLKARMLMGVLPETLNLYERLSGREFLILAGELYDVPRREIASRADMLLNVMSLTEDAHKLIVDYSVGMRKKIALAALVHRPSVLFLDEPFEGVDPVSSRVIRNILSDLTKSGTTIFFSSHIMEVVERLCTRVGIISQGILVADGTLDELRQRASGRDDHTAASLEDVFLQVVGANTDRGNLSWLEQ